MYGMDDQKKDSVQNIILTNMYTITQPMYFMYFRLCSSLSILLQTL